MKKESIYELINNKATDRKGILLLNYDDAEEIVDLCYKNNIKILGIDVFSILHGKTQPHLNKSIDFSSDFCKSITPCEYLKQFSNDCKQLLFEITI